MNQSSSGSTLCQAPLVTTGESEVHQAGVSTYACRMEIPGWPSSKDGSLNKGLEAGEPGGKSLTKKTNSFGARREDNRDAEGREGHFQKSGK